jgi:hypothetical protein
VKGFVDFAGSCVCIPVFSLAFWRSSSRIFDDSGVTFTTGLDAVLGGSAFGVVGAACFEAFFCAIVELAGDFAVVVATGEALGALVVALRGGFAGLIEAFVDLALVVAFIAPSGISTSTASVMTFFGLPLFLTTSADMLGGKLVVLNKSNDGFPKGAFSELPRKISRRVGNWRTRCSVVWRTSLSSLNHERTLKPSIYQSLQILV